MLGSDCFQRGNAYNIGVELGEEVRSPFAFDAIYRAGEGFAPALVSAGLAAFEHGGRCRLSERMSQEVTTEHRRYDQNRNHVFRNVHILSKV